MTRVFLAGEGRHELGGRGNDPPFATRDPGVVEALLHKCRSDGWDVAGARRWKDIPKLAVGRGLHGAERRCVLGLAALAEKEGCHVVAFVRDRDHLLEREEVVERAIAEVTRVKVAGGVAIRTLDAWCLALLGHRRSEDHGSPKAALEDGGCRTTEDRVAVVEAADLDQVPEDARSLRRWVDRARTALAD